MIPRDVIGDLTPADIQILELLIERHAASGAQIAKALHYTRPGIHRHLRRLAADNLITIDPTAPGHANAHMYRVNPEAIVELAAWMRRLAWHAISKRAQLRAMLRVAP